MLAAAAGKNEKQEDFNLNTKCGTKRSQFRDVFRVHDMNQGGGIDNDFIQSAWRIPGYVRMRWRQWGGFEDGLALSIKSIKAPVMARTPTFYFFSFSRRFPPIGGKIQPFFDRLFFSGHSDAWLKLRLINPHDAKQIIIDLQNVKIIMTRRRARLFKYNQAITYGTAEV